jgi:rhodanese-related sulfurtransferase
LSTPGPKSSPAAGRSRRFGSGSLDRLVEDAADRIARLTPEEAFSAAAIDGVIIDIRSQDARELHGVIPGSLHIPRTVLEWRVAVDSPWRNPHIGGLDERLILICDHGYSSVLAAGYLVELGFHRAGDVIGGFEAWAHQGLPIAPWRARRSEPGALLGTDPPE